MTTAELAAAWRERAELFARHGAVEIAETLCVAATELETAIVEDQSAELGPSEASEYSGYSTRRLRQLEEEGLIENVGRKGSPRYVKHTLPVKRRTHAAGTYDPSEHARELIARRRE